jgi:glycosyltransferase involved in cell wall biosynthesis
LLTVYHYYRHFPATEGVINGGIEKSVAGLASGLVEDPTVRCAVLCEGQRDAQLVRPERFEVRCFAGNGGRLSLAPGLRDFVNREIAPDSIVVLHAIFHPSCQLMSRLLRKRGIRYVPAPHDPYHPTLFAAGRLKKAIYWRLFERPMLRNAAAVQVLDRRHEKYLRDRGVNTRVIEVGNGFSVDEVPDESTLRWRTNGPIRILFLGRLDPINKGLDLLIDAFAQIAKSNGEVRLTLQGSDKGEGAIVRRLIQQHGLDSRIEVLPPDYNTRASDLTARHDLFVLPSRFEGFGLSALEAMLAARPLLVTDIAGLAPHVRESGAGVVVDSTVESIRAGIEQLIASRPMWRDMGLRARRYVLENLRWSPIAASAIKQYRSLF